MTPAVSGPVTTVTLILPAAVILNAVATHVGTLTASALSDALAAGQNRGGAGTGRGPDRHRGTSSGGDSLGGVHPVAAHNRVIRDSVADATSAARRRRIATPT